MPTPLELAESIAAYIPTDVAYRMLCAARDAHGAPRPGEFIPIEAAVLFADVAGFTPLSERLAMLGPLGTEELTRVLNDTFAALITQIEAQSGIVARFSGDALTAFFPHSPGLHPRETVIQALVCAQAMQRAMAAPQTSCLQVDGQTFNLSVKIGAGYGPAALLTVGDSARGLEHVLAGAALDLAAGGEKRAHAGQVVAHAAMLALVGGELAGEARDDYNVLVAAPVFSDVIAAKEKEWGGTDSCKSKGAPFPRPDFSVASQDELSRFIEMCSPFLPRSVSARLAAGEGDFAGEHRRVTSVFVGFTGVRYNDLAAGGQLQSYFHAVQKMVARFDGHLNRVLTGDKGSALHILFGAPDAHEDDLFRALRCALALRAELAHLPFITDQRIGIASGIVFAGPVGSAIRREYTVIGDKVILSWRFATAACGPDCILVDSYTHDRTAQRFEYQPLPPLQIKGKTESVRAFRLLSERASEAGLAARYLTSRWSLVGREHERANLVQAADCALAGHGSTIAVSGHAGVGKTRLIEEVVRHWFSAGGNGYSGECLSHGLNVPYLPWLGFLSAFFDFHEDDPPQDRWRKVEATVADEAPELLPWVGVFAPLLNLSPLAAPLAMLDAAERRRKLFEIVTTLVRARASHTPLLVLFEDVHWADRSSLDLLDHVAARVRDVPLLLCLSFRTPADFELEALASPDCTWESLEELERTSAEELVRAILGEAGSDPKVIQLAHEICEKAQGNPLFVEEILNSLIENGVLVREEEQYRLVGDASQVHVPDSLTNLLMARLDRLEPPSRDLTQVASVIGQRFTFKVLRGVYPYKMADTAMRERLDDLVRIDITRLERPDPELAYLFKHALTYEVVYNCLPFARRRELHTRVGDFLELLYQDAPEKIANVLARHFAQGQKWDKALSMALIAGAQAQELYANQDALAFYELVEQCLEHLPLEDYWIAALRLYLNRGRLYRLLGRYAATEADLHRALTIAREHQDLRAQAEAYNVLAESYWWQSRQEALLDAAFKAYQFARESGHTAELAVSTRTMALTYHNLGDHQRARDYLNEAYRLAEERGDEPLCATVLTDLGRIHAGAGELDEALNLFCRALEIRQKIGLKDKIASTLVNIAIVRQRLGQFQEALAIFKGAIDLARESGSGALPYSLLTQAETEAYAGYHDAARRLIEEALSIFAARKDKTGLAWARLTLGREVYFDLGQDGLARSALEDALLVMRADESYEEVVHALTSLGALALRGGDTAIARRHLDEAQALCNTHSLAWPLAETLVWQGRLALAEGRGDDAERFACAALDAVERHSSADWCGPAFHLLSQVAFGRGDRNAAAENMVRAVECIQKRGRHVEQVAIFNQLTVESHTDAKL